MNKALRQLTSEVYGHLSELGDTWLPQTQRMLGAPKPITDETFSSWCWRIAARFRLSLPELFTRLKIDASLFELDSGRIETNIDCLAYITGIARDQLESLTWSPSIKRKRPLRSMTAIEGLIEPVCRYCPQCLASDTVPYIRRLWRLSYITVCHVHRTALHEACPHCSAPVSQRSRVTTAIKVQLRQCHRCHENLSDATPLWGKAELIESLLEDQLMCTQLLASEINPPGGIAYWYATSNGARHYESETSN